MQLIFKEYLPKDAEKIAHFISSEKWPFHSLETPSLERVQKWVSDGDFEGNDNKAFWILENNNDSPIGIVCFHDLTDDTPIFDLRLKSSSRHKGYGKKTVKWLENFIFTQTNKTRIEGNTRVDNKCMRSVFRSCNWVKESHHRRCWPDCNGALYDSITYAILKEDWKTGKITPVNWHDE